MKSHVQAIIFPKDKFDISKSEKWLNEHSYKPIKEVHETDNFYRYRISKPVYKNYITKKLPSGIEMVMGLI